MANAPKVEGLTDRQRAFVEAYVANRFNGADAAMKAGYNEKSARTEAWRLLRKENVAKAISDTCREKARLLGFDANRDRIIQELCSIAFANPRDYGNLENGKFTLTDWSEIRNVHLAAVSKVVERPGKYGTTTSIEFHSKTQALDMLCKLLGEYAPEKIEATVTEASDTEAILANADREEVETLRRVLYPAGENRVSQN